MAETKTRTKRKIAVKVPQGVPTQAVGGIVYPKFLGRTRQPETAYENAPALTKIFPGWTDVDQRESHMVGLPSSAASYFPHGLFGRGPGIGAESTGNKVPGCASKASGESKKISHALPLERGPRYAVLHAMSLDPTINCALKLHIANALASTSDTNDAIFIKSKDGKPDELVDELNAVMLPIIRENLDEWAWKASVYGSCFSRVYGRKGVGVEHVRTDFYTHPRYIQKFTKAGRLAGYTTNYQNTRKSNEGIHLLPPWYFVGFEIPEWWDNEFEEPTNVTGNPVDLALVSYEEEGLVESNDFGLSLLASAYGPWLDLLDALCSLRMSRRNAARLERIIGVNTGKLDPERAARYLSMTADRISTASSEIEKQSWLEGNVQVVANHFVPMMGEKGNLQIDAVQGTPDINGIEDVNFYVKRLGAALGVDPSLLGFGDFLSGGLGDGGYFRMSVMAAARSRSLRTAIKNGIDTLCEIHLAYKYGKFYTPDERPWEIQFNALNTAIEQEEQTALEQKINAVSGIVGTFATLDQEMAFCDKREFARLIWNKLKFDEKDFNTVFPEAKAQEAEELQTARMKEEAGLNDHEDEDEDEYDKEDEEDEYDEDEDEEDEDEDEDDED